jgi:hypothetical protein
MRQHVEQTSGFLLINVYAAYILYKNKTIHTRLVKTIIQLGIYFFLVSITLHLDSYSNCLYANRMFLLSMLGLLGRKIGLIEGNAKCRHFKKLRQVFICLRPRTPPPPTHTHCIRVYSILLHTGKGGGER